MKAYEKNEVDITFSGWKDDLEQLTELNVIPILDNATNGDMIKIMFPYIEAETYGVITNVKGLDCDKGSLDPYRQFWSEWWNAPYEAESE